MTTARCPACGASVAPAAPWCTLCYADLRPEPAPTQPAAVAPEPVSVGASPAYDALTPAYDALSPAYDALGVLPPAPLPPGTVLAPDPHLDAPVMKPADVQLAAPSWPCRKCGIRVPMADDACPQCYSPFLAPEDIVEVTLPVVGNLRRLDTLKRALVGLVGATAVTAVLLVLAFIAGAVL